MSDEVSRPDQESTEDASVAPPGLSRRTLIKQAAVAGAVVSAPLVIDSLSIPAAAATNDFPKTFTYNNNVAQTIAAPCKGRKVHFVMTGGGGAGGSANVDHNASSPWYSAGGHGGAGTQLQGHLSPQPGGCTGYYTISVLVGQKGQNGDAVGNASAGGTGDRAGGDSGEGPDWAGAGGGGGGASSIKYSSFVHVVAPGGGGGGGAGTGTDAARDGGNGASGLSGALSGGGWASGNAGTAGTGGSTNGQGGGGGTNSGGGTGGTAGSGGSPGSTGTNGGSGTGNGGNGGNDGTWEGGGGGGGGGGYNGGGGGGGGAGTTDGADHESGGGGGGSGSAYALGATDLSVGVGAAGGLGGNNAGRRNIKNGAEGTNGSVTLSLVVL